MLKRTNTSSTQVVVNDKKQSKLPPDEVPPQKQDEESDRFFQQMGANADFSAARVSDDMEDEPDDYHENDGVPKEEILHVQDDNDDLD